MKPDQSPSAEDTRWATSLGPLHTLLSGPVEGTKKLFR